MTYPIESLLSARLFLSPVLSGDRIYFASDSSGRMSLYAMDAAGSVPEPLLPPHVALHNPALLEGPLYTVLSDRVVVLIDADGDENFQPSWVPLEGGIPQPIFGDRFKDMQVTLGLVDRFAGLAVLQVDPRDRPVLETYEGNLITGELRDLGGSLYGNVAVGHDRRRERYLLVDEYTSHDAVLYLWESGSRRVLAGVPLSDRVEDPPLTGFARAYLVEDERAVVVFGVLFSDSGGLAHFQLDDFASIAPVEIEGLVHQGIGELEDWHHLEGNRYLLRYNIDGASWGYEAVLDARQMQVTRVVWGLHQLSGGVVQGWDYDHGRYLLSFSSAVTPSGLVLVDPDPPRWLTHDKTLGVPATAFSPGEDASYHSFDGLRISARLYRPAPSLSFEGARPVIFYIHGGPQSQERPDFTWFSMPLIQWFTMNGFAVFVPNVRGSSGYGADYMRMVDRDWGGADRLDHVEAVRQLRADPLLDLDRAGVMGRSYGGYMTLTLAGRHPQFWKAACDMFGPFDLFSFLDRIPAAWKTYFALSIGDSELDRDLLIDRSPKTHLKNLACPLLVVQGANDPRVVQAESDDLVAWLAAQGKQVDYLVFPDEGHDLVKTANKARCYRAIVDFFVEHLQP